MTLATSVTWIWTCIREQSMLCSFVLASFQILMAFAFCISSFWISWLLRRGSKVMIVSANWASRTVGTFSGASVGWFVLLFSCSCSGRCLLSWWLAMFCSDFWDVVDVFAWRFRSSSACVGIRCCSFGGIGGFFQGFQVLFLWTDAYCFVHDVTTWFRYISECSWVAGERLLLPVRIFPLGSF